MDGWSGENAKYARVRDGNLNKSFLNFVKVIFDRGLEKKGRVSKYFLDEASSKCHTVFVQKTGRRKIGEREKHR